MSEWPCVVARPLSEAEVDEMYLALETRRKSLVGPTARNFLAPTTTRLLTALAEGRVCIEVEDAPTAEERRDDHELINDDQWEAAKEGRL